MYQMINEDLRIAKCSMSKDIIFYDSEEDIIVVNKDDDACDAYCDI